MRAMFFEAGRAVIRDTPDPEPGDGEVLIRIHLAGICGTDLELLRGYAGFEGIAGHEFVGTVTQGSAKLRGRRVVGEINCVCGRCELCGGGLSNHCPTRTVVGISGRPGAFAELLALPERNCREVPDALADETAVFAEPLAAAYQIPRQVKLESRTRVAILGTGRLGLLVAQVIARSCSEVVAFGRNPKTLELLDRKRIRTATIDDMNRLKDFDVVIECTGSPDGLQTALRLVRPRGTVVLKTTCAASAETDLTPVVVNEVTLLGSRCGPFDDALGALAREEVDVASLITRRMNLADGPEAMRLSAQPDHIKILLKVGE